MDIFGAEGFDASAEGLAIYQGGVDEGEDADREVKAQCRVDRCVRVGLLAVTGFGLGRLRLRRVITGGVAAVAGAVAGAGLPGRGCCDTPGECGYSGEAPARRGGV